MFQFHIMVRKHYVLQNAFHTHKWLATTNTVILTVINKLLSLKTVLAQQTFVEVMINEKY
jgi:hypothetical protein